MNMYELHEVVIDGNIYIIFYIIFYSQVTRNNKVHLLTFGHLLTNMN